MSHKSKCIASFATAAVLLFSTVFANDYSGVKTPVTDAAETKQESQEYRFDNVKIA